MLAYSIWLVWYEVDNSAPFQNAAVVGVKPLPTAVAVNAGLPAGALSLNAAKVIGPAGGEPCEMGADAPPPQPRAASVPQIEII
jgi:hypothetical protein